MTEESGYSDGAVRGTHPTADHPQTEMNRKEAAIQSLKRLFFISFCYVSAFLMLLFLMSFLFMFEGLAYEDELVGGYTVEAVDTRNNAAICRGIEVVPPMVCAYGWNDDFIIARQHGTLDGRSIDLYAPHWYLIEVHNAKVHGPLAQEQFAELRGALGVPAALTFTKFIQAN